MDVSTQAQLCDFMRCLSLAVEMRAEQGVLVLYGMSSSLTPGEQVL